MYMHTCTNTDSCFTWRTPCSQEGNVPYVVEGGYGSFSKNPEEIADTISDWLGNDELLATMSRNSKKASRPNVRLMTTSSVL